MISRNYSAALSKIDRKEKLEVFLKRRKDLLNVMTRGEKTLLNISAQCDPVERVQELLDMGADCTKADQFGNTPLHRACTSDVDSLAKVKLFVG